MVFCMSCKLCTPISADEALETCLVPDRGILAVFLYPIISYPCLGRTRVMQCTNRLYTPCLYFPLPKVFHFPVSVQASLSLCFVFSFQFPSFFFIPFLCWKSPSVSEKAKAGDVPTGCLVGNKHWVAL